MNSVFAFLLCTLTTATAPLAEKQPAGLGPAEFRVEVKATTGPSGDRVTYRIRVWTVGPQRGNFVFGLDDPLMTFSTEASPTLLGGLCRDDLVIVAFLRSPSGAEVDTLAPKAWARESRFGQVPVSIRRRLVWQLRESEGADRFYLSCSEPAHESTPLDQLVSIPTGTRTHRFGDRIVIGSINGKPIEVTIPNSK